MYLRVFVFIGLFSTVFTAQSKKINNDADPDLYLIDDPQCVAVKSQCANLITKDDISVLECLQSLNPSISQTESCQTVIWSHVTKLIENNRVKEILAPICGKELSPLKCGDSANKFEFLKCIVTKKELIQNVDCVNMILRLENVAFEDYHFIGSFLNYCGDDIDKFQCGRFDSQLSSQFKTVLCLQENIINVEADCKREMFKLSELQADNMKLDRQLYTACAEDHRKFCSYLRPESGRIFKCLMTHTPNELTHECNKQVLRRQKLISQDYRISKGLMRACREDIKKTHCRRQTSVDKTIRLAQILLCLENVGKNGTKLDSDCELEMMDHRKMLMEDYRLSPEIVQGCSEDIQNYCQGLETGGKTIHCLMEHARRKPAGLKDICQRAIEALVKEADVGEDWRVDPVLHEACFPVVRSVCGGIHGGDARVMSCLMDNIGADHMTEQCEDALIQIQYFISRDFKLDPQLYRACKDDAYKLCHASGNFDESLQEQPTYGPQVLPCLYRNAYNDDNVLQVKKVCLQQIQRVMRQRAISVDLQPEVEEVCIEDLAMFCYDKVKKGEETLCLQKKLEDLKDDCRKVIESLTEAEAEHVELNPYIMQNCRKEMQMLCEAELKNDEGDVMECLIAHKNDPTVKSSPSCRASIEHFQIISLKNFRFTYKFKLACKSHALHFCGSARTKSEVVTCLSEKVTNDTIKGIKSDIHKECRQQLKAQLFQQRENIEYDPKLKAACASDIKTYCSQIQPGNAQVLECLQSLKEKLSDTCEMEVFKIKKLEIYDNTADYALMTMCADAIDQFCPHHERETILDCLKLNKDAKGFGKKCKQIVVHRMAEQNSNYQLNPGLQTNCKQDINKFCTNAIKNNNGKNLNGVVIKCLKGSFKKGSLTHKCEKEIVEILREQALDVSVNPLIRVVCKNELDTICHVDEEDAGRAEECLKDAFMEKKIMTPACKVEVANMIEESQADIHVDPLLQQACALDLLTFCKDVPQGNGRHIKCLKLNLGDKNLSRDCKDMLTKRLTMYENAALVAPIEDMQQLYHQVVISPAKHYFFLLFVMMFGSIFIIGTIFGRAFRRHMTIKNK